MYTQTNIFIDSVNISKCKILAIKKIKQLVPVVPSSQLVQLVPSKTNRDT